MAHLPRSPKHSPRRRVVVVALSCLMMILSILVGSLGAGATFFGAALLFTAPGVLIVVALLVGFLLTCGGVWIAAKMMIRTRSGYLAFSVGATTMLVLASVSWTTVFQPLPSSPAAWQPPPIPPGVHYWNLSTGSRIAYLEVPAQDRARTTPLLLVGGGPGEEDVANPSETQFFGQLARLGYNVYFYDQIGSGLSARLADPGQYTLARHIADLEAIREEIGAPQIILLGASWGGTLVANYMAAYPRAVARAIFTSPAPINQAEWTDFGSIISRLPEAEQKRVNQMFASPQFLAWYLLGRINPRAAHSLVSDREADAFFNTFLQRVSAETVCNPAHASKQEPLGNGFYDNIFTTNDARTWHGNVNPRTRLSANHTPTLILTGACNYITWAATWQYKTTLPNSTLLYFPRAGHEIYLDQPDLYLTAIRTFLQGAPLPLHPWTTAQPPPTLQN